MMVRKAAAIANLLTSLWILYLVDAYPTFYLTGCRGCDLVPLSYDLIVSAMLVLGLMLVIVSGACLVGKWLGFPLGALLSLVAIPMILLKLYYFGALYVGLGVVFAVLAVVLDLIAITSRASLPEQNHPLNLPVFG